MEGHSCLVRIIESKVAVSSAHTYPLPTLSSSCCAEAGREAAITALRTERERWSKELATQRAAFEARIADLKDNAYKLAEMEVKT